MEHGATGTAIVLFTDVVDSTGLRTRLGDDDADAVLESHERVVRGAIGRRHGTVVKTLGDGVMATFAAATDAIAASVDMCRTIAGSEAARGVELRVGLSAGDVAYRQRDCHGIPVVEAARLCAAAGPGSILASDVVRILAGTRGAHQFEPHGSLALKGLAHPLDTVEVVWRPPEREVLTIPLHADTGEHRSGPDGDGHGAQRWPARYELVQQISAGGEGQVWKAHDRRHDRDIALKIRSDGSETEVRALLELRPHPCLPLIRDDFTLEDGRDVIVMDWVPGDDLAGVLAATGDPGLPLQDVLDCITSVAEALDHLHGHEPPLVHGDVKPANVIRRATGEYVLVDFGSAAHAGEAVTGGTSGFIAPEVAAGSPAAPAADVYALAATAAVLLQGRSPASGKRGWPGLTDREVDVVSAVVFDGLAHDPGQRPHSAGEFAKRLCDAVARGPEGVVALLSVTCSASPGAWERCPDETADVLAKFSRNADLAAASEGGRKLPTPGYGISALFVYDTVGDAVTAAARLHTLTAELDRNGVGVVTKVGLHIGPVNVHDGLASGPAVEKVAQLGAAARPGESAMSSPFAAAVNKESVPLPGSSRFRVRTDHDLEVKEEDPRDRIRRRRAGFAAVGVLSTLLALVALWAVDRSIRLGEGAAAQRASSLVSDALRLRDDRPDVAALAAVEAAAVDAEFGERDSDATVDEDIRAALISTTVTPTRRDLGAHEGRRVVAVAVSQPQLAYSAAPGRHELLASYDDAGTLSVWDLGYGRAPASPIASLQLQPPGTEAGQDSVSMSPDGRFVAVRTGRGVEIVGVGPEGPSRSLGMLTGAAAPPSFGPNGAEIAADRSGNVWDLACTTSGSGCGDVAPVWQAPDQGLRFTAPSFEGPSGFDAVISADSIVAAVITRRTYGVTRTPAGLHVVQVGESSVSDERCLQRRCRLVDGGDDIVLDVAADGGRHALSLIRSDGPVLVRLPQEAQVPHTPLGLYPNPRGTVARPNEETPADSLVLLSSGDGDLFTQAADLEQGIGGPESRKAYRGGGDIGIIDATATFVVGADASGGLHLSEVAPGQSFINEGLPEADPTMPVEGTGLVVGPEGAVTPDCCELRATDPGSGETMQLGRSRPGQVRGVVCGADRYLAVPGESTAAVYRFPDPRAGVIAAASADGGEPAITSMACGAEAGEVLVAGRTVGVGRLDFGGEGPVEPEAVELEGCCRSDGVVALSGDGTRVVVAGTGGTGKGGLTVAAWDLASGMRLDSSGVEEVSGSGPVVAEPVPNRAGVIVALGVALLEVGVEGGSVEVERVGDTDAPVASMSVSPDGSEAAVGTSATVEVYSLRSARRIGHPLGVPGHPRYDSAGALRIHPVANQNGFVFAQTPVDAGSLVERACDVEHRVPAPEEWTGVSAHEADDPCAEHERS